MAASAWTIVNSAKEYLLDNTIDIDGATFDLHFYTSASNASAPATLSSLGSLTNQVASGNGYSQSGEALTAVTWATGASASEMRFDSTANVLTATGGSIANIRYAAIIARTGASGKATTNHIVAVAALTTAQFTVTDTNTLTTTPSANGIFELN